jgi:outer membrane protein OmpA-like peptidoglycan-associated protein
MRVQIIRRQARALLLTAAACAAALPAFAAEKPSASRQENIGVVAGLTLGAAAAGPFGAIFGAAAGAWLGDRYHRQTTANAALTGDLSRSRTSAAKLSSMVGELQADNDQLAQLLEDRRELETQVMFRTGEATLSGDALEQLKRIGSAVATMPDMKVHVSGYADVRGSEEFNATLSQQRADMVAAVLESTGVDRGRLEVEARGESAATSSEGDLEGYAFDRKVIVRVTQTPHEAVAAAN